MLIEEGLATGRGGCQDDRGKWHVDVVTGNEDRKRLQKRVKQQVASGITGQHRLCRREMTEAEMENTKV